MTFGMGAGYDKGFQSRPFLKIRRAYQDILAAGGRKHIIHGLVQLDVTDSHAALRAQRDIGRPLSFTAFMISAMARAVDQDRIMHAYRFRNRLVLFDEVDVNTQVEMELDGQKIVKSLLIRAANGKSVQQITAEIRRAQQETDPGSEQRYRGTMVFLSLPRLVRALPWRAVMANPWLYKRLGGTVAVSSVGMFGSGGGWAIPITPATLMLTLGGISLEPRFVDGVIRERELLSVTVSVDHDIVDGATAARFVGRLRHLVESAEGLPPYHEESHDLQPEAEMRR